MRLSINSLLLATASTILLAVNAGIDLWRTSSCYPQQDWEVTCELKMYVEPWYTPDCDVSPFSTQPELEPNSMKYDNFPGHMYYPGACGSGPLDFYDTGNGYDVYFSGGDGTLLGHCNWMGDTHSCGFAYNTKYYSCDIPVC